MWRVCPVCVPLVSEGEVEFRGVWRVLLSVSAVTVVALLSVLLVVLMETESEFAELSSERKLWLESVKSSSRVGDLIGIDGGLVGGASVTHSSSESSKVKSKYADIR